MLPAGHVGLNVSDLDRSVGFYTAGLGLDIVGRSDEPGRRYAFLGDGTTLVLTLWEQATSGVDTASAGLHHLSFQAPDIDTVHAVEQRLRDVGATFVHDGVVPHGEGESSGGIFFLDPDGIRLEVYAPSGADGAAAPSDGPTCGFF